MACHAGPKVSESGLVLALDAANSVITLSTVEVLVVAGGGGGGTGGGGGGAGGLIYNRNFTVTPGSALTVTVGNGGAGTSSWGAAGTQGGNSVFGSLTAIGGGSGLHRAGASDSGTGGSGGGDAGGSGATLSNATSGQGFSGGNSPKNGTTIEEPGGGGGGAGGPGESALTPTASDNVTVRATEAGAGGPGLGVNISGTFTYYAGGGGGSNRNGVGKSGGIGGGGTGGTSPTAGTTNTGGGGGGTGYSGYGGGGTSAAGGSGIVIVRYPGPQKAIGGTVTSRGGYTIHTFTSVGSTTFTPLSASSGSAISGLTDISNNGNFGTPVNGPTYSGANGGSVVFDGVDDRIQISSTSAVLGLLSSFSVDIWFNRSASADKYLYSETDENDGNPFWGITSNTNGAYGAYLRLYARNDSGSGEQDFQPITSGYNIYDDRWHNLVLVYGSNLVTFYVDGVSVGSNTWVKGSYSSSNRVNIGGWYISSYGSGGLMSGKISSVKSYNRALSADEISQNFNALRGRFNI